MAVTKWSNVGVAMQSAAAAAVAITGITQANPAVVATATTPANGDYVRLTVLGMSQVNGRVFRVAGVVANTSFQLDGVDSTNFDAFASGSFEVITFGTTFSTITGVTGNGGDFDFIDTTTIHDSIATQIPGLPSALSYSFENIWDVSDAALTAMKTASDNQEQRAFLFTFANGQKMVFNGYVGASLVPGGNAQDKVTTSTTVTAFGAPTYYAT